MSQKRVSITQALEIKRRLWNNESQMSIAASLELSQGSISRISLGYLWPDVPWPDGSVGKLDKAQAGRTPTPAANKIELDPEAVEAAVKAAEEEDDACLRNLFPTTEKPTRSSAKRAKKER